MLDMWVFQRKLSGRIPLAGALGKRGEIKNRVYAGAPTMTVK